MIAYKLMRMRSNGTLGSLFINRRQVIPLDIWIECGDFKTKGYSRRPGWHACQEPIAPHLVMKGRIWCEVEVEDFVVLKRPAIQGTKWFLAQRMRVKKLLPDVKHEYKGG